ncbi:MAG: hypothetical protein LWX56_01985 [Ignavibacteria bacterium]|nr:hypothetical protein [Ignavibacteria bacterium]
MKNYIRIFCVLVAAVLFASCGGTYESTKVTKQTLESKEKVIYTSFWLKTNLGVVSTEDVTENGMLKTVAKFKNLTSSQIKAEIKVKFISGDGEEFEDSVGWNPFIIDAGEIKSFHKFAVSPRAKSAKIYVRLASEG